MDFKQVIVFRSDLKLGKGKIAAQVAHASVSATEKSPWKKEWMNEGQKKSVVKCSNEKELLTLMEQARTQNLPVALIEDAGLTQIPPGTKTCLGIGPAPEEQIDKITGKLKLL